MADSTLVLLVEDEMLIWMSLQEVLDEVGFALVVASNGAEAMAELEADATRFHGMLTDIRLGSGPNGWIIARRARELMPGVPMVFMSGDSANEWDAQGVPNSVMVVKPFVMAQIITVISTLLNEASSPSH